MRRRTLLVATVLAALIVAGGLPSARAESVRGKWRLGVTFGGYAPQSAIESDAANTLTLLDTNLDFVDEIVDPREDTTLFGTLEIQPGTLTEVSVQYAFGEVFLLEGSIGLGRSDIGDVEVSVQYSRDPGLDTIGFDFQTERIPVGRLEVVPLQLAAVARYRPHARFNPYVGAGLGYQFHRVVTDRAFDDLSRRLESSVGIQAAIDSGGFQAEPAIFVPPENNPFDMQGARVDAPDTFTLRVFTGAEYQLRPGWAVTVELGYLWSARSMTIGFNGEEDVGIAVPEQTGFIGSAIADRTYGPVLIEDGGLVDGGSLVPARGQPLDTDCFVAPALCIFDRSRKDGIPDPGLYYVNGGKLSFDAFRFTIGIRHTFP